MTVTDPSRLFVDSLDMDEADANCDVTAIRSVIASWYCAMQEGGVAELLSLVTPDVIVKAPDSPTIEGKAALEQALSAFFETNSETLDYVVAEVEVHGQLAFARISESATILPRGGAKASSITGIHLTVLRRQPDGDWLIARDISSLIDHA